MNERKELVIPDGYTPGPIYVSNDGRYLDLVDSDDYVLAEKVPIEADAKLFALAPDMAEEIKRLRAENINLRSALGKSVSFFRDCAEKSLSPDPDEWVEYFESVLSEKE